MNNNYLTVGGCEQFQWGFLNLNDGTQPQMPDETQASQRTFIFLYTYLVLHTALVVISLCAFFAIKMKCVGRKIFGVVFVPWIVILIAIIILDVLATVYYIIDIVRLRVSD